MFNIEEDFIELMMIETSNRKSDLLVVVVVGYDGFKNENRVWFLLDLKQLYNLFLYEIEMDGKSKMLNLWRCFV